MSEEFRNHGFPLLSGSWAAAINPTTGTLKGMESEWNPHTIYDHGLTVRHVALQSLTSRPSLYHQGRTNGGSWSSM